MTDPIARQLAAFIEECTIEVLPPTVTQRTKLHIIDTLGAIIAGHDETSSKIIAEIVSHVGGHGNCTVIASSVRRSATSAALINGAAGHAVEIDDDHRTSALHPGVVVVPTALAMTETFGGNGKTLLEGVIAGYEVMIRVGNAFLGSQDSVEFHSTSTCGVFGAAAAAGRVLKLNND